MTAHIYDSSNNGCGVCGWSAEKVLNSYGGVASGCPGAIAAFVAGIMIPRKGWTPTPQQHVAIPDNADESDLFLDEVADVEPLKPFCANCFVELCGVLDEWLGVLGPLCSKCRRDPARGSGWLK